MRKAHPAAGRIRHDQSGITGLETAIVLIAFIVVAAVFAFAVLTTGLFTTERAKDTTMSAVGEAQSTLSPKGAVVAEAAGATVDVIKFKLANSSGAEAVDLAGDGTLVTYTDATQSVNASFFATADAGEDCTNVDPAGAKVCWGHTWIIGAGNTLDGGEIVEFIIQLDDLDEANLLGPNTQFKIEVIPAKGAVIPISRKTPLEIQDVMNLD